MKPEKTVIYYTSNRENPEFEEKIRINILENCGGLPIISVSQIPLEFGKNICVGDVGHSYLNTFRQILIGAKAAKTDYLVFSEADFLYPKEYFEFKPINENIYRYDNVWIVFNKANKYYKKTYSNGAQIAKRRFVIDELEGYLHNQPQWIDGKFEVKDKFGIPKSDYNNAQFVYFSGKIASVSFKTGNGMTKSCTFIGGEENILRTLPHWGDAKKLKQEFLC